MPVDDENAIAFVRAERKCTLGFHVYETDVYVYDSADVPVGTAKGVGFGVLVERPGWGSLWSWLDGVGRGDIERLAGWLRSVADATEVQPPLDVGVDENIDEAQVTLEHAERATIRLRFRGDASPAQFLYDRPEEVA